MHEKSPLEPGIRTLLEAGRTGPVVALTGAGVSAESGVPTFRGPEGYWRVGSREYHPQEMATRAAFDRMPREVWRWYLYRRGVCRRAEPNPAHRALAALERALGERFTLVTQNVDGLHLRAGNSPDRTHQVHGNIDYLRAADGDDRRLHPLADDLVLPDRETPLAEALFARLVTPAGQPGRPHVLWFDECYDEALYRSDSALRAVEGAALLLLVGASGQAALPVQAARIAAAGGAAIVDVDPHPNPFAAFLEDHPRGGWLRGTAGRWLPEIAAVLAG